MLEVGRNGKIRAPLMIHCVVSRKRTCQKCAVVILQAACSASRKCEACIYEECDAGQPHRLERLQASDWRLTRFSHSFA